MRNSESAPNNDEKNIKKIREEDITMLNTIQ